MFVPAALTLLLAALPAGVLTTHVQYRLGRLETAHGGPTLAAVGVMAAMALTAAVLVVLGR